MDQLDMLYNQWTTFLAKWYATREKKWFDLAVAAEKRLVAVNAILGND